MAKTIATIGGYALAPGVSKNRRWYTAEHIKGAVEAARDRLARGDQPMVMLTHHGADDDSTRIAAKLREVSLTDDGRVRWAADVPDTQAGRDIATLVDTSDGKPSFLEGVSIRGAWTGKVRKVRAPDGELAEQGDGLELHGLDFTHKPGVPGARVDTFAWSKGGATETSESVMITESVEEARVTTITEDTEPAGVVAEAKAAKKPYGDVPYADPGYLDADGNQTSKSGKPGVKRYPLSTEKIRAAWSYINQKKNAAQYTPAQLKRIKGRIKAAMKRIGAKVTDEGWVIWPAEQVTETLAEAYITTDDAVAAARQAGSFRICATNGPLNVELSSWCVDPADLEVILCAAAQAASDALQSMDPDMDGDIDLPGAGSEDTDRDMGDDSAQLDNGDGAEDLVRRIMAAVRGESAENLDDLLAEARTVRDGETAVTETATTDNPATTQEAAADQGMEAPMTETATQEAAGQATAAPTLPSQADINAAVIAALDARDAARKARKTEKAKAAKKAAKAAEAAKPAEAQVAESDDDRIARLVEEKLAALGHAPAVQETEEQRVARLVEERLVAERQQLTQQGGGPSRKGLVTEHTAAREQAEGLPADFPMKDGSMIPMEQWSEAHHRAVSTALQGYVLGRRAEPAA